MDAGMPLTRQDSKRRRAMVLWVAVAAVLLGIVVTTGLLVAELERGPMPPFLRDAELSSRPPPVRADDGALHLAGSGSSLSIIRTLADAFERESGSRVVVHESIGSTGGIRAVHDGAIDLGLVSRALKPAESDLGLVVLRYARAPIIVAVHGTVPDTDIDYASLLEIYGGIRKRWADGSRIVVLQREQGDSSHSAVAQVIPEFAEVNEQAYRDARWRVLYHDATMREALISTQGSVGLYGAGALPDGGRIRGLSVGGVAATVAALESGDYPFTKDLALVSVGQPTGMAAAFEAFVGSDRGRAILRERGYLSLQEDRG